MQFAALPSDDGQMRRAHAGTHEQNHILVARVAVGHHLPLECLELVLIITLDID